jgi:hypothetical protein
VFLLSTAHDIAGPVEDHEPRAGGPLIERSDQRPGHRGRIMARTLGLGREQIYGIAGGVKDGCISLPPRCIEGNEKRSGAGPGELEMKSIYLGRAFTQEGERHSVASRRSLPGRVRFDPFLGVEHEPHTIRVLSLDVFLFFAACRELQAQLSVKVDGGAHMTDYETNCV